VAGHGLAAIAMQAGVALVVLDERPEQARASIEAIRTASRAALDELRAVLATPPEVPDERIDDLVGRARAAGLPVDLRLGDLAGLPPEAGAVAYRVVREALTNVMRHAGVTTAEVSVDRDDDGLIVTVGDRGRGGAPGVGGTGVGGTGVGGTGLAGLRARAEAAGGTLTAGPRPGGGFAVTLRLPHGGAA
jgi:signal transduction histidine kinase